MRAFKFKNGDFVPTMSGSFAKVSGSDKVARDIDKLLSTDVEFAGSESKYSRYNPDYGTQLNNKKLFKGLSEAEVLNKVNELVRQALEYYVSSQKNSDNLPLDETVNYFEYYSVIDAKNKTIVRTRIMIYMADSSKLTKLYSQEIA